MSLELRAAGEADWDAIWPIYREVMVAGETYCDPPDVSYEDGRAEWMLPAPGETWVALDGGRVVGTSHLGPNRPDRGAHIANASYLVDASVRGRGIGRALVLHSLDRIREQGYRGLQFNAVVATNTGAVRLYEDLGFSTIGVVPGGFRHPSAGFVDLLIMYHDLAAPRVAGSASGGQP